MVWLIALLVTASMGSASHCRKAAAYAEAVVSGQVDTCLYVQQAAERQLRDRRQKTFRWHWDEVRAERICRFIECLPHVKGRWPAKTIILEPWQCFNLTTTFGWVDGDGFRRYRRVYWELPRKNSKTTLCAGIGLYLFAADGEPGSEVYSAAVSRDQAKISWGIADKMVRSVQCRGMRDRWNIAPYQHHMELPDGSVFRPLSRDADSLEGLNVHGGIIDELHAHKTREVYDVLDTATASRKQPLIISITTAGSDTTGIGFEQHDYTKQVLSGTHEDERYWGIIYSIDQGDDWTSDEAARKANPNLDVSVNRDDLIAQRDAALVKPSAQASYKTRRLNLWVSAGDPYFNMLAWNACPRSAIEDWIGEDSIFALDLASKIDIAVVVQLYRRGGRYALFGRYYLPESAITKENPNYEFYRGWQSRENFIVTPGNVIDFEWIEEDLQNQAAISRPKEICFDPWQAVELSTRMLKEGLPMVEVSPTTRNFSEPMKSLDGLILDGKISHNGDPVLTWMLGNVTAELDRKDNVYPRKEKPEKKIDGAVAAIMAQSRMPFVKQKRRSIYASGVSV